VNVTGPVTTSDHETKSAAVRRPEAPSVVIVPVTVSPLPDMSTLYMMFALATPHTHMSAAASNPTRFSRMGLPFTEKNYRMHYPRHDRAQVSTPLNAWSKAQFSRTMRVGPMRVP